MTGKSAVFVRAIFFVDKSRHGNAILKARSGFERGWQRKLVAEKKSDKKKKKKKKKKKELTSLA